MAGFADVTFAIHLCRGNQEGRWLVEGDYEPIARPIFQRIGGFHLRPLGADQSEDHYLIIWDVPERCERA